MISYQVLKNRIQPFQSKRYLKYFRERFPDKDPHHLLGSLGSLKISDSLLAPLSRSEHNKADRNREAYLELYLPMAINILQDYILQLESELDNE